MDVDISASAGLVTKGTRTSQMVAKDTAVRGDDRTDGTGCIANQFLAIQIAVGKKALSFDRPEEDRCLAMYFISCMNNDCLNQIIDEHMVIEGNTEELKEVANLAKRCLRVKGEKRPSMKEVAMELQGLIRKKTSRNDLNPAKIEYLLGKASTGYVVRGYRSNTTTARVDSMAEDMLLHGGR
ncbi:Wall-associated receptor kinase 5 [Camellia lanceoleosa]|uniref:Wall-associated receptor kinase 5 n=1 Tax=Camellia lanceoleosa TaxID=1840588 RepID=A0ACC0HII9_9ERIC|nr:Wall-associated receptor kinase 5 [Camellia lanceoleosa]